jgi:hypothetical protein
MSSALEFVAARQRERESGIMYTMPDLEMTEATIKPKRDPKKGRKALTVWVNPKVIRQVKIIAAEQMIQQQQVLAEALNDVFAKYNKDMVA